MRNGIQKNSPSGKGLVTALRELDGGEFFKIAVLFIFGLISAALIIEKPGLEHFAGSFLISTIILVFFYRDIKRYKPSYLNDYKMLLLLGILISGTLLTGRIFAFFLSGLLRGLELPDGRSFIYGIPIAVGGMLVTLIFDFHTAIIFSFVISLLTGIWLDNPLYSVYAFLGSLTAAFSVIRCKRRSAIIKGGIYVSAVNTCVAAVILLLHGQLFSPVAESALLFAALSGLIVASVVSLILPLIEYLFGVTTDISLVELLDLNQPLMRNLMIAAPGTYHHSIIVGNLAEAAAEAVGANPLLARVTAYYHDIGKMKMPEYFVENQSSSVSKHERLSPHMSSMILMSHVKEGVELGKQFKLPQLVMDIVQQHHGTSLMTFFYQKAVEQQVIPPASQDGYRYPGPRPQTRVAAIVMMADAVEAASRALTDPTPARISALVERIINNIFLDGQINECELTLKDISEIKRRFTHILTSIFHRRIEYPELDPKGAVKAEKAALEALSRTASFDNDNGNNYKEQTETPQHKP
jgi:hypothetical protein